MENTRNYYYSIDLGTTNSVMAYANMTGRGIRPVVLDIDRKNAAGSRSRVNFCRLLCSTIKIIRDICNLKSEIMQKAVMAPNMDMYANL